MAPIFAQQPSADDMAQQARMLLASQSDRLPAPAPIAAPVFASPQMPDDAQAYPNEGGPGDMVVKAIHSLFTLPQRAIQNSQQSLDSGNYDPSVPVEAALTAATGGLGGAEMKAGETALGAGPIRAYHGSPHSFDAFNSANIGTGEGAQAYGHGLYFAENEGVAKSYRDMLGGDTLITPKCTIFDPMSLEHMNVRSRAHSNGSNLDATIETAQKIADSGSPVADMAQRDLAKLQALKAEGGVKRNPGSMYEVDINADPGHFLDWDKPIGEQSPVVQRAFAHEPPTQTGSEAFHNLQNGLIENKILPNADSNTPLQHLQAQYLREAGIPGIKYLDGGSRTAGEGSSNYVVFDHNLIDIARKYGLAGAAVPPLAAPIFANAQKEQKS